MTSAAAAPVASPPAEYVLSQLDSLPTLAPIALKLLHVTTDERSSARDAVALIERDPALSAKILAAANSAAAGAGRSIAEVSQAVVLLGFDRVRSLVLTVKVFECFRKTARTEGGNSGFDPIEFWKHALAVACAARRLARIGRHAVGTEARPTHASAAGTEARPTHASATGTEARPTAPIAGTEARSTAPVAGTEARHDTYSTRVPSTRVPSTRVPSTQWGGPPCPPHPPCPPEDAYVAGLLHDLGKIALFAVYPKAYDRVVAEAHHRRCDIADCEREVLDVDHTVAGRRLATRWRLPRRLQDVIWLHHLSADALPAGIEAPGLVHVVHAADAAARDLRIGLSGNYVAIEPAREAVKRVGVQPSQWDEMAPGLVEEVAEHVQFLGLGETTPDGLFAAALSDANSALGRMHERLVEQNRRLTVGERYAGAIHGLLASLAPGSELAEVVRVSAQAATLALQRSPCIAFACGEDNRSVHLAMHDSDAARRASRVDVRNARGEWSDWFAAARPPTAPIIPLPRELASCLELLDERPAAPAWLIPISRGGAMLGGLVIFSETAEPTRLADEQDSLIALCSAVALGMEMSRAHASARRLAEDLAESNRRLQQAQVQLLRTRTLSMIAEMASGAAHELNSPLTVISGRAQLLSDLSDNPEAQRALEVIRSKAHECSRIVTELMDFARPRDLERAPIDLAELIGEVRGEFLTQSRMPASSFTVSTTPRELPPANIDRAQIKSVLSELINNAADAIADRPGRLAVNCRLETSDEVIELTVRDNGVGMTPAVLERAFDPFFSHRKAGRRRGFGLARAHRIVEAHGGRIWLESRPDEGTTAHVVLPIAATRAAATAY